MKQTTAAVLAGLLATGAASAQEAPVFVLDEIIFSAGLTALEASRTGARVDVITSEDLEETGDIRLADYLATRPGLSISANGGLGAATVLRVRGLDGRYVPVLIDGIDITDPSNVQTFLNFGALTTGGISRIEILTGSQSAIYGSEAIGGVISITTLEAPDDPGTRVTLQAEAGAYETYRGTVGVATRFARGDLAFSATRVVSAGFSAADEANGNTEADGHRNTTLTLRGGYDLTDTVRLGFAGYYIDSVTDQDGFDFLTGLATDDPSVEYAERRGARVFAEIDAFGIQHEIAATLSRTDRYYPIGFTTNFEGDRREFSYQGTVDVAGQGTFVFGAETSEETFTADALTGSYRINSVFGDYTRALGEAVDLAMSLRHDDHSVYGGQTTGRLALAWRPGPDTVVRAALGTGFRAPSLFELYSAFGNPALQPEESRSAELGVEHGFGFGLTLGATLFHTEIDNLIQFAGASYNQVPGTSTTRGVELTADYAVTDALSLFGSYTYTDARDRFDARLLRVPLHDLTVGITGEFGNGFSGTATVQRVMDRIDTAGPVPDYTLANVSIGYALTDNAEAYLRVENLFDEQYQTARGYGTSGRAIYLGVRATF